MKRLGEQVIAWVFLGHFSCATALACPDCRALVESGIYSRDFAVNLFLLLVPVLIIVAIGGGLYHADSLRNRLDKGEWADGE